MNYEAYMKLIARVGAQFARDADGLEMTVLHNDGLYRHVRFKPPTGFVWFDLVTWPGTLTITGGHGTYTFSRERDMFGFFRASNGVNVDYWAEKLRGGSRGGGRDAAKVYDEDAMRSRLVQLYTDHGRLLPDLNLAYAEDLEEYEKVPQKDRYPNRWNGRRKPVQPPTVAELRKQVAAARRDGSLYHEEGARRLLAEWEAAGVVRNAWEWDLRVYDYHFVWCCHAILWGIAQYLAVHAEEQPPAPAAAVVPLPAAAAGAKTVVAVGGVL